MRGVLLRELLDSMLPPGTRVVGGGSGLDREVTWATLLRTIPARTAIQRGDLLLFSVDLLSMREPPLSFSVLLELALEREAAGLAVVGPVPEPWGPLADEAGLPLLALPEGTSLADLANQIARFITARREALYEIERELQRRFQQAALAGEGLPAILRALAEVTGKSAWMEDAQGAPWPDLPSPPQSSPGQAERRAWLRRLPLREEAEPPVALFGPDAEGRVCLAGAVLLDRRPIGVVCLLSPSPKITERDRFAVAQATAACALVLLRERSLWSAEARVRGEFLAQVLRGELPEAEARRRARILNEPLEEPMAVAVFRAPDAEENAERLAEAIRRLTARFPRCRIQPMAEGVAFVFPPPGGEADLEAVVEGLRVELARALGLSRLAAGVGGVYAGPAGLSRSFREAVQSLQMVEALLGGDRALAYQRLDVYRLLYPLRESEALEEFYNQTLGPLERYDLEHRAELIPTLEAFFACDGNLQRTAERLFLHRNSLAYRLRRIQEITGMDLRRWEDCFRLQLALKIRPILRRSHERPGSGSDPRAGGGP
ncbi:MAG: helix-turn-helix domain-containing protein [Thermoflexus sp.]|uniref:helix-turn-helix domain-containing protein n=1 Tax=Thermoflexus sp. TaxID=1969742 RepID=UPI0025DDC04A|nr:helix-turn-helix domain-containing protein [Thermoflexus sp.]MCS6964254.1 helix-turn-helix domain-containing protein [Thermoflexus sp.]MDW8185294.1 helix-turn-helix domain-containing protein [Anaerolineae bacterium]